MATTETDIELVANGAPVVAAIDAIAKKIGSIQGQINQIVQSAGRGGIEFDRKMQDLVKGLTKSVGDLKRLEGLLNEGPKKREQSYNRALAFQKAEEEAAARKRRQEDQAYAKEDQRSKKQRVELDERTKAESRLWELQRAREAEAERNAARERQRERLTASERLNVKKELARQDARDAAQAGTLAQQKLRAEMFLTEARNRLRKTGNEAEVRALREIIEIEKARSAEVRAQQRLIDQRTVKLSPSERLQIRKQDYAKEVAEAARLGQLDKQRELSLQVQEAAWKRMNRETDENKKKLLELINLEKFRLSEVKRLQAEANKAKLSPSEKLSVRKEVARQEVIDAAKLGQLEQMRLDAAQRIAQIRNRLKVATDEEARTLRATLEVEKARSMEIEKQASAARRAQGKVSKADERAIRDAALSLEVRAARETGMLARVREQTEQRLLKIKTEMATLTGRDKRDHLELLRTEEARLRIIEREIAAEKRRANESRDRPIGAGGSILPAGGIGTVLARTAAYGLAGSAIFATLGALREGAAEAIRYEDALVKLQAISGSTSTQMEALSEKILAVGRNSRYSNNEIVEASTSFAQAGFTANGIGEALQAASNLASASGSSMAESVDLITAAIGSFQLQETEATKVSDNLVAALNRSKLTVTQVAQGIQYAGATAFEQNITFEELTATMGALAQAGIRSGSTIGTGLRQFLVDLQTPSQKLSDQLRALGLTFADVDVKTKGLPAVLQTLSDAGFGSAEAYGSLETRAAAAYLVLKNNIPVIEQLRIAQAQQGVAAEAAAVGMGSLTAEWQRFKNNVNASVEEGSEGIRGLFREMLNAINANAEFAESNRDLDEALEAGRISEEEYERAIADRGAAMDNATSALAYHNAELEAARTAATEASNATAAQRQTLDSVQEAIDRVSARQMVLKDGSLALQAEVATLTGRFAGLAQYLDGAATSYDNLTSALRRYQQQQLAELGTRLNTEELAQGRVGDVAMARANRASASIGAIQGRLPSNVVALWNQLRTAKTPQERQVAAGRLTDALPSIKNPYDRRLVEGFITRVNENTSARGSQRDARQGRQAIAFLTSPIGQRWQQRVQDLGKPGADPKNAKKVQDELNGLAARATDVGQRQAYLQLAQQASRYTSAPGDLLDPKKKRGGGGPTKAERAAARAANEQRGDDKFLAQSSYKTADMNLKDALKAAKKPMSAEQFAAESAVVEETLSQWVTARLELMQKEIASQKLDGAEAQNYEREIQDQIELKQAEVRRALAENFSAMVEANMDAAERAFDIADARTSSNLGVAEGRRQALDRTGVRNSVPEFVRQMEDLRLEREREMAERARIPQLQNLAGAYAGGVSQYETRINELRQSSENKSAEIADLTVKMEELRAKMLAANGEVMALNASFATGSDILPQTWGDAMTMLGESYKELNGMNKSLSVQIQDGLGGVLDNVGGQFQDFFTTLITKPGQVLNAFASMVQGILRALQELVAQLIARKILEMLINLGMSFLGGGFNQGQANATVASNSAALNYTGGSFAVGRNSGGPIGFSKGGRVENGVPNRDTVHAMLSRGEYVLKKSAVESLGPDFVAKLNDQGARALAGVKATPALSPPARQETNVYVVAPEEQPAMTPNDVIVTIHKDIMKGGATKKLIKHVAQGG